MLSKHSKINQGLESLAAYTVSPYVGSPEFTFLGTKSALRLWFYRKQLVTLATTPYLPLILGFIDLGAF